MPHLKNLTSVSLTARNLGFIYLVCFLSISALSNTASAFTPSITGPQSSGITRRRNNRQCLTELGPIARNGLGYDDVILGQGRRILPGDTVYCYYIGSFPSIAQKNPFGAILGGGDSEVKNTVFDSVTEGEPFSFEVGKGQVIRGMDYGILGFDDEVPPMNVGGKRKLLIPSPLAYGSEQVGPIPANQDLEFELEVLDAGKESDVSLKFRLGGYAVALGVPLIILLIGFNVISNL